MERLHQAASRAISGCLASSPIPFLFSEASLPLLRVTLTHFTLSSYERALRLPISFIISGLARLGVKPRFCRSFWGAVAFCYQLMLPSTSPRETRLASFPSPSWNLPSFIVEFTLSTPCSRSDFPLTCQGAALILTLSHVMVWCSGQTVLFLFLLEKATLAYLPTAGYVALMPLFPSQQAQYAQVFPPMPAPFCKLFAGLGGTNKSATSLLLSDSRSILSSTFPFTSISLAGIVLSFLLFYRATMGPRTLVSHRERRG